MFIGDLKQERNFLHLIRKHHIQKLTSPDNPSGILLCQKHGNQYRWQRRMLHGDRLITVNMKKNQKKLAQELAVNLYRLICIQYLEKQISSIDSMLRNWQAAEEAVENCPSLVFSAHRLLFRINNKPAAPADFFRVGSPYRPFVIDHLQKEYAEILNWYLRDFEKNQEHPENLQNPVELGFNVRSKSEALGADLLYHEGILFHYEEKLFLNGKPVFPDFYIPLTHAEKYAWEHFGAMDQDDYLNRNKFKIQKYLDNQWLPGINMITTFETRYHPLTEETFYNQLRWLKNRYRLAFPDLPPDESFNMYDLAASVELQERR